MSTEATQSVEEGSARVLVPGDVFYNPVQVFNRDLTVCALNVFGEQLRQEASAKAGGGDGEGDGDGKLRILEALAASGLRSMRFAKEVANVGRVVANDNNPQAVRLIEANAEANGVADVVEASLDDAVLRMLSDARQRRRRYHVVDLDPYGSCAPFLDAGVQCVADGGLLCATCTDTAVLCGSALGTCYGKYGAVPYRGAARHEASLRILLQSLQAHAARHSRYIRPLLAVAADFYVRVFARVYTGQAEVKRVARRLAMLFYCPACDSRCLQPLGAAAEDKGGHFTFRPAKAADGICHTCRHCGTAHMQVAGPIWQDPIHDFDFVQRLLEFARSPPARCQLATADRLVGMLSVVSEELPDSPLFYTIDRLARTVKCSTMPMRTARSALLNKGYRVSISHCERTALKTDAPPEFVWDMVRAYKEQFGVKVADRHLQPGSLPRSLLVDRPLGSGVDFTRHPLAEPKSKADKLLRFHVPPKNWGPKPRAKRTAGNGADAAAKKPKEEGEEDEEDEEDEEAAEQMEAEEQETKEAETKETEASQEPAPVR